MLPPPTGATSARLRLLVLCAVGLGLVAGLQVLHPADVSVAREARSRSAAPRPLASDARGWAPMHVDADGRAVGVDPCQPLRWVLDARGGPPSAAADAQEAAARVERATGLDLVYAGTTDEQPSATRPPWQPERYGQGWAPVLVTWSAPAATSVDLSAGGEPALAVGGGTVVGDAYGSAVVSGQVVVNTGELLPPGFAPGHAGQTLLHEWGHVLGLDHVDDPLSLMYPRNGVRATGFSPGDLAGLAALSAGGCGTSPSPGPVDAAPGGVTGG